MPEFVVVTFPTRRRVFMDNQPMGQTGDRLTIQAGFHDFDLGSPADYVPATQNVNVVNTSAPNPLPVVFAPMIADDDEAAVAEVVLAARTRATIGKAAKKKAAKRKASTTTRGARKPAAPKRKKKKAARRKPKHR